MIGNYFKANSSPETGHGMRARPLQNSMVPEGTAPFLFCYVKFPKHQKYLTTKEVHDFPISGSFISIPPTA